MHESEEPNSHQPRWGEGGAGAGLWMSTCVTYTLFEMWFPCDEPPQVRVERTPEAAAGEPVSREAAEARRNSSPLDVDWKTWFCRVFCTRQNHVFWAKTCFYDRGVVNLKALCARFSGIWRKEIIWFIVSSVIPMAMFSFELQWSKKKN